MGKLHKLLKILNKREDKKKDKSRVQASLK